MPLKQQPLSLSPPPPCWGEEAGGGLLGDLYSASVPSCAVWDLQSRSPYISLALVSVCINEPWESYNLSSLKQFQNSKGDGCKLPHWWGCQRSALCSPWRENGYSKEMVPKPAFALPIRPGQKLISFSIFFMLVSCTNRRVSGFFPPHPLLFPSHLITPSPIPFQDFWL